jgi:hypothetical protein
MDYYCVVFTNGHEQSEVTFVKAESILDARKKVERLSHCLWVDAIYKRAWVKEN